MELDAAAAKASHPLNSLFCFASFSTFAERENRVFGKQMRNYETANMHTRTQYKSLAVIEINLLPYHIRSITCDFVIYSSWFFMFATFFSIIFFFIFLVNLK